MNLVNCMNILSLISYVYFMSLISLPPPSRKKWFQFRENVYKTMKNTDTMYDIGWGLEK